MADIQADDMKHGLYDDRDQRAESIDDLPYLIATKLLEVVSQDDLEDTYYDVQLEWAQTLPDEELMQTARDLGILSGHVEQLQDGVLDELTEIAQKHNMGY